MKFIRSISIYLMTKLSILIPARNEQFLQKTVEDILSKIKGDTDIFIGIDGYDRSDSNVKQVGDLIKGLQALDVDYSRINIIYEYPAIGQRAMTNKLAKLSDSEYLMKIDAHCSFSDGFDIEMLKDMEEDITLVPVLLNLRPYDWICPKGHRHYQNKKPEHCNQCDEQVEMNIIWQTIPKPVTSSFTFTSDLIFAYNLEQPTTRLTETMAIQGSGWMVSAKKFWELELSDEKFGSWGQQGVEIACKTWLSGGRVLNTKDAWMGHWFRQEDEFPYQRDMKQVDEAYQRSKDLFLKGKWDKAKYNLAWLIRKFNYPADWSEEKIKELCVDN